MKNNNEHPTMTLKSTKIKYNSLYSDTTREQIKNLQETAQYLRMTNTKINENIRKSSKSRLSSLKSFFLTPTISSSNNNIPPLLTESTSLSKPSKKTKFLLSPSIQNEKFHSILKINQRHYCPFCEHCNSIKDDSFDKLQYHYKETSDFISKSAHYILKENYDAFTSFFNDNFYLGNCQPFENEKKEYATIEDLLFNHPKHQSPQTKDMFKVLNMFLHSLMNNKLALEDLIKGANDINDDLMNKFIKGFSYDDSNDKVLLDTEFEGLFDKETKEKLIEVIKEEYLNKVSPLRMQITKNEAESNKKLMVLFLILTQCLSETFNESKERAVLLFKVFKMYFVELNKKLMNVIDNFKAKNEYYKELCRGIIKERTPDIVNIDLVSSILCNRDVSVDNLQNHKEVINTLLSEVRRFQDNYFNIKSQLGIETSFLRKWIYGYDKLKQCYHLQQVMKTINIAQIADFIRHEVKSKDYSDEVVLLLTNVEIFQRLSGVKNYLLDQKIFYQKELARLTEVNQNIQLKKKKYKTKLKLKEREWETHQINYEEQILFFKEKLSQKTNEDCTQTDIDYIKFNKYQKNNEIIKTHKRLTINKIDDYLLRIKWRCSRYHPLSKTSLLKLIPELLTEKKGNDEENEKANQPKLFFSEFFLKFFIEKFKLKKITQQNTEETIMAIVKYSPDDKRIDYFRRFLSIGSNPIRREVLDIALVIITELPFSYYKIFYEDKYDTLLLSTEFALEILYTRFKLFYFAKTNFSQIILASNIYDKNNRKISKGITRQNKESLYYLSRLYQRGNIFINDLLLSLKNNTTNKVRVMDLVKHLQAENKEYEVSDDTCYSAIEHNFTINQEENSVNLTEFCNFFLEKRTFKIPAFDFIELCINKAILLYDYIEVKARKIFDCVDVRKAETLSQKQFNVCIEALIGNQTNNWKLNEFFTLATLSGDIGFVGKEEFIDFVMNTNDLLMPLIKQYITDSNI